LAEDVCVYEAFASGIMRLYGAYICDEPFLASLWGCAYGEKLGPIGEGREKRAPPDIFGVAPFCC
jgi:hypothetical protein